MAKEEGIDLDRPWKRLSKKHRATLLNGTGDRPFTVTYENRFCRTRRYETTYEGALPWLERRYGDAESDGARDGYRQFMREVPCATCNGGRLNPISLAVTVGGWGIFELSTLSLRETAATLETLELTDRDEQIAGRVIKEILARLNFLLDVGLDYLTLMRSAATLAGGEAQRIRLATQIGSGLVGVLYILDEPSIGLHQRDNQRLIETLVRLRDLGNTLIVVEHDLETIRSADHLVDIGPGAGDHGGRIVAEGSIDDIKAEPSSITGDYLAGAGRSPFPQTAASGRGPHWSSVAQWSTTCRGSTSNSHSAN